MRRTRRANPIAPLPRLRAAEWQPRWRRGTRCARLPRGVDSGIALELGLVRLALALALEQRAALQPLALQPLALQPLSLQPLALFLVENEDRATYQYQ